MATAITVQYSGLWSLSSVANGLAAGTWPAGTSYPATGAVWAWGAGGQGQLGLGNRTYYSSPKQVGALTNWGFISGGDSFTAALTNGGALWVWGKNDQGQLGLGNRTYYSSPKQVGSLTNWANVDAGTDHVLARKTDGTLWVWGNNANFGALGTNNVTNYSSPVQVGALTNWKSISAGYQFSGAIKTDGTLWMWGKNTQGQLGLGDYTNNKSSPQQVGSLTTWKIISCGKNSGSTVAIKTDGTLWSWGYNNSGQLGIGNLTWYSSPKQVGSLTNWVSAVASGLFTIAVNSSGQLYAWGSNAYGQLGQGNTTSISSPVQVGVLTNWSAPAVTGYSCNVIKTDGTLWTWGYNPNGQLGQGNITYLSSPKQVGSLTTWQNIGSGLQHVSAIKS